MRDESEEIHLEMLQGDFSQLRRIKRLSNCPKFIYIDLVVIYSGRKVPLLCSRCELLDMFTDCRVDCYWIQFIH